MSESVESMAGGLPGMIIFLAVLLSVPGLNEIGEEKSIDLLVQLTSPDRLDNPRREDELWSYLREKYPTDDGEGIDHLKVAKGMASIWLERNMHMRQS